MPYNNTVKHDRNVVVIDAIDAGTGAGKLVIGTAAMAATLVEIALDDPCGTDTDGVLTFSGMPRSGVATGDGTAAAAILVDSDDTTIRDGLTVGLADADVILDGVTITTGKTVRLTAMTITHG